MGLTDGETTGKLQNADSSVCLSGCSAHHDGCVVNGTIAMAACLAIRRLTHCGPDCVMQCGLNRKKTTWCNN